MGSHKPLAYDTILRISGSVRFIEASLVPKLLGYVFAVYRMEYSMHPQRRNRRDILWWVMTKS